MTTRRTFLKTSALASTAVGLGTPLLAAQPTLTLGEATVMPQLGFGTWTLQGDVALRAVSTALEAGYRLIDSAQGYGNEAEVGQAIRASGIPREQLFITTKISPDVMRAGRVGESILKSREALGGAPIDLLLIHWPVRGKVRETWEAMEQAVDAGDVKALGLSNFNPHHVDDVLSYARHLPVLNQIEIHPFLAQRENAGAVFSRGLAVESWAPLGSGAVLANALLARLAKAHGKSPAQIVLRWHLQRGLIVIPRSSNPAHIRENLQVFDFELSLPEMAMIDSQNLNRRGHVLNDPECFPW